MRFKIAKMDTANENKELVRDCIFPSLWWKDVMICLGINPCKLRNYS